MSGKYKTDVKMAKNKHNLMTIACTLVDENEKLK